MTGNGKRSATTAFVLASLILLCRPCWPIGVTLTQDQLKQLLLVVQQRGSRTLVPPTVATLLDLRPKQLQPDIKQIAYLDAEGNRHGFAPLNDGSGFFMFRYGATLGHSVYRVDPNLQLVHAARSLVKGGPLLALPQDEAQKELDDELARWARLLTPMRPPAPQNPQNPFKGAPAPEHT